MAKTKQRKSKQGTVAPSHANAGNMKSLSATLDWGFRSQKKKTSKMKKKKTKELMKIVRMAEHDKLETPGNMPADTVKMEELVKLLAGHKLDRVDDKSCHERKGIQSGREFMRSLREIQVWEVEKIKPGQIMVACPVCKLERMHKCNQEFRNLRNHFKREHKRFKFYLVKTRCLKCPVCLEIVSASQLGVHFGQGMACEKNLLVDQSKVTFKEDGSEKVPGASTV